MSRLKGKAAIVTGAAMGLGAAYARGLAAEGAKVCLADIGDASKIADPIRAAGDEAIAVRTDVSSAALGAAILCTLTLEEKS